MSYSSCTKFLSIIFSLLLFVFLVTPAKAVIYVPFANAKSADKLEEAGQFAKALEARELIAEFCEYFSIPEFEDDLEFFKAQGHLRQVEYTEEMLAQFREWAQVGRQKAAENLTKVELEPKQRLRYRQRIRRQLIGAADLYPKIHNSQLGIQVSILERRGVVATDFEKAAEGRNRNVRLYEKVSIPYVQHALEEAKIDGDPKEIKVLEAKLAEYRKALSENQQRAEVNLAKAEELRSRNRPEHLYKMLEDPKLAVRNVALEAADALGLHQVLWAGLANSEPSIRQSAYDILERKHDVRGLLHAMYSNDSSLVERATETLKRDDVRVQAVSVRGLISALNDKNSEISNDAHRRLIATIGGNPVQSSQSRQKSADDWETWLKSHIKPGLLGLYHHGRDFQSMMGWRADPQIDFKWDTSPPPNISEPTYSIRWVGMLEAPRSDTYQFFTYHDDGVRVWVDQQRVIDDWNEHEPAPGEGKIHLDAGLHDIEIEFFNAKSTAIFQLFWATSDMTQVVIPATNLWHFPPTAVEEQ